MSAKLTTLIQNLDQKLNPEWMFSTNMYFELADHYIELGVYRVSTNGLSFYTENKLLSTEGRNFPKQTQASSFIDAFLQVGALAHGLVPIPSTLLSLHKKGHLNKSLATTHALHLLTRDIWSELCNLPENNSGSEPLDSRSNLIYDRLIEFLDSDIGKWNQIAHEYSDMVSFDGFDFSGRNLTGFEPGLLTFNKAIFRNCNLSKAKLNQTHFAEADFSSADITSGDLYGANLWHARFDDCILDEVNFYNSDLRGVDFSNVRACNGVSFNLALCDEGTKLPPSEVANYKIISKPTKKIPDRTLLQQI